MNFGFKLKTNRETPMINCAIFQFNNAPPVCIDRDDTEWVSVKTEDGFYETDMEWRHCYVWDGEEPRYLGNDMAPGTKGKLLFLELEDDTGSDYFADAVDYWWDVDVPYTEEPFDY